MLTIIGILFIVFLGVPLLMCLYYCISIIFSFVSVIAFFGLVIYTLNYLINVFL